MAERGGSTASPATASARPGTPIILAIEGPLRSASSTPTRQPVDAHAAARLAVTVDLPPPPLPDTTAPTKRTASSRRPSRACCSPTWATTFEPPSPTMSLYFFIASESRRTARAVGGLLEVRGGCVCLPDSSYWRRGCVLASERRRTARAVGGLLEVRGGCVCLPR